MVLALAIEMAALRVCVVRQASQKTNERRKQGREQNQRDGKKVEWSGTHPPGGWFLLSRVLRESSDDTWKRVWLVPWGALR